MDMKSFLKLPRRMIVLVTLILLNSILEAQDLNIYETINYINSKLDNCPCDQSTSGYAKFKIDWTSDGYLTVRETTYSEYSVSRDVGNNIIKAKGRSLNFDLTEIKKYNSINSFIEIRCIGENSYQPANCITETNVPSGDVRYYGTLSICFNSDYETQRSLLNAFKHLGCLIKEESSQSKNTDPFSDENYNKNKSNNVSGQNVAVMSTIKKDNPKSNSKPINSQPKWIEKKGEVGNFYLSFPNYPNYESGTFHGWNARDKDGQVTYLMSYTVAPSSGKMTIEAAEKYLLPSMLKADVFISKSYLNYNGYSALDFLYETNHNPPMYKQGRVFVRGKQVYVLQVISSHKDLAHFDKFVKSLRFY